MVQRDHPSPTFTGDNPNTTTQRPPPTAQTSTPEGSAMGQNDPVSREGPTGQGIGKVVATEEDVPDSSIMARGARSPHDGVEEPAAGGAAVVGTPGEGRQTARLVEENEEAIDNSQSSEEAAPAQRRRRVAIDAAVEPSATLSKEDLLHRGYETSTPAGKDMQGTLWDHLRLVAHPGEQPAVDRDPKRLAFKMLNGQLVHFRSAAEKASTEEFARTIAEKRAQGVAKQGKQASGEAQPGAKGYQFTPVSEKIRSSIVDQLARGVYDPDGLLQGAQKYKSQPLLNQLAQQSLKNSTYTTKDGDRFLRKVQSLLPRADAQAAKRRPQQAKTR